MSCGCVRIERRAYSRAARESVVYISAQLPPRSSYYANTICIFFVRMYECRIHTSRVSYLPYVTSKVFDRAARGSETRPANVVSTRSSRNLGNFFRIPSLREAIARTFRCPRKPILRLWETGNFQTAAFSES